MKCLKMRLLFLFRGLIWLHREGNGTLLQHSCLENPMDGGAWWAAVHGVAKSRARLNDFTFIFHFHALEKEMATHSSVLAWRIPGTGEPGGLPSMGSHRVGHNWSNLAAAFGCKHNFGREMEKRELQHLNGCMLQGFPRIYMVVIGGASLACSFYELQISILQMISMLKTLQKILMPSVVR